MSWNLPPGCTQADIDAACGDQDPPVTCPRCDEGVFGDLVERIVEEGEDEHCDGTIPVRTWKSTPEDSATWARLGLGPCPEVLSDTLLSKCGDHEPHPPHDIPSGGTERFQLVCACCGYREDLDESLL